MSVDINEMCMISRSWNETDVTWTIKLSYLLDSISVEHSTFPQELTKWETSLEYPHLRTLCNDARRSYHFESYK